MERLDARATTPDRVRALLESGERFWLDIDSEDPRQHALLADVFHFHALAIEDTLNRRTRVKVEGYDGYLFIVLRAMQFDDEAPPDSRRLDVSKICLFLGATYLVSVHAKSSPIIEAAVARCKDESTVQVDPARVAHLISDVTIDAYFPILDRVDQFVEQLEHTNLADVDSATFREVMRVRRLAFGAHRSLRPQQAIFDELAHGSNPLVSRDARLYFRDVYDHAERISESLDAYRELIGTTTDSYIAQLSTRLDYATTIFAAIATVALPFLIVSSLFGMNFRQMPLVDNPNGFWIIVGIQAAISVALLVLLRRRRLL